MKSVIKKIIGTMLSVVLLASASLMPVGMTTVAASSTNQPIKILAIGNSYSNNATEYISRIAESMGIEITAASLYYPGCSLKRHVAHYEAYETLGHDGYYASTNSDKYEYLYIDGKSYWDNRSIQEAIAYTDWDYITIQQMPDYCDDISSYWTEENPYVTKLYNYVLDELKESNNTKCEILIHQGWSFSHEMSINNAYQYYPVDYENTAEFFAAIESTVDRAADMLKDKLGLTEAPDQVLSGKAVQLAKDEFGFGDTYGKDDSIYADTISHLSNIGKYLVACVWIETFAAKAELTATDVRTASYIPTSGEITEDMAIALRSCAHEAVTGEADTIYGDWRAVPNGEGLKVTSYLGETPSDGKLVVPALLSNKKVNLVSKNAFKYLEEITVTAESDETVFESDSDESEPTGSTAIVNSGFEDGLEGWSSTEQLIAEVATDIVHSGTQAIKLGATAGAWNNAFLYQEVEVKANTDYVWDFWFYDSSGNNKLAGVRTADGTQLLPSTMSSEDGGVVAAVNSSYDSLRPADNNNNWHQGLAIWNGKWHKYTVKFNSGDQTKVLLTLDMFYSNRSGYTDDWSITEFVEPEVGKVGEILNGGFEDGLTGWNTTDKLTAEIATDVVHSGTKSLKLGATANAWYYAYLYQEVEVKANTDYVWDFWFYATSNNASYVGVRTADGSQLLPSTISTEDGGSLVSGTTSFDSLRSTSAANWHSGLGIWNGWHKYTVKFNTGDQTKVLLTFDMFYSNRTGYTDDWSLTECAKVGEILNGDFEEGLTGWKTTDKLISEVATDIVHSGTNSVKLGATSDAWYYAYLYQEVEVKANTDYVWDFWFYATSNNASYVGVRTADGTQLLPSTMSSEDGGSLVSGTTSFDSLRSASVPGNWHFGLGVWNGWHKYTVKFNSGNQTKVLLTFDMFYSNRTGYTDDWSISEAPDLVVGDINGDGGIDSEDLIICRKHLLGMDTSYEEYMDINEDGDIDVRDLVALKKKVSQ